MTYAKWRQPPSIHQIVYELRHWTMQDKSGAGRLRKGAAKYFLDKFKISRTTLWRISRGLTTAAAKLKNSFDCGALALFSRPKQLFGTPGYARRPRAHRSTQIDTVSPRIVSHPAHRQLMQSILDRQYDIYALSEEDRSRDKAILLGYGVTEPESEMQLVIALGRK